MPPHPSVPVGFSRITVSSTLDGYGYGYAQLFKIFLLVLVAAVGIRFLIIKFITRKRRPATSYQSIPTQEKDTRPCQASSEKGLGQHRVPRSEDQPPPTFKPIYPWTSLPQPLPGPYDPRFYPLPTIRRHSYNPPMDALEQTQTISYSRRVSTNSIPASPAALQGAVMTSTKGWRRNQWVVAGE